MFGSPLEIADFFLHVVKPMEPSQRLKFAFLLKINYHLWYLFKILRYICTRVKEVIYTANSTKGAALRNYGKN